MSYQNDFKPKNELKTLQRHHRIHLGRVVRVAQVRDSLHNAGPAQWEAGLRKEDVFINLVEVAKENWSFGNGEAQYAT
jgi:hypothetical protein